MLLWEQIKTLITRDQMVRGYLLHIVPGSVSDPDPYHLTGSGSTSGTVDPDPGSKNSREKLI